MAAGDNYVSSAKFADIVDDCLWYTLEHLSFKEKFAVMRVCKRWRKVTTELIERCDCIELEMEPNEISQTGFDIPHYRNEESVKRNLETIFGRQAQMLFNYKLENVENVSIKGYRHTPNSHNQPLTLKDIGWLFERLPRLKSLNLKGTSTSTFGARGFQIGGPFNVLSNRLKSLKLNSFLSGLWLSFLFESENVLEELCLRKGFYQWPKPAKLFLLKKVRLYVYSLHEVSKVIRNSHDLLEIRITFFRSPYYGMIFKVLSYFTRFTQLKTLKLSFVKGIYGDGIDEWLDDELHFPNLQHFKLSGISVQHSKLEKIFLKMPAIKSLKLRNVYVSCTCKDKVCRDCPRLFIEKIASLEHLKELHLNYRTDTGYNFHFVDVLEKLIDDERLPRLRKFRCTLANLFSPSLFESFAKMAWESPKESFIMIAPFNDQPNKEELLSIKPRNHQVVHSRCTSKTDNSEEIFMPSKKMPPTARKSINVRR